MTAISESASPEAPRGRLGAIGRDPRAWLVALAFAVRLLWVLFVPSRPVGDFALYREAAEYLWDQGNLDSEFVYMPGYVILLAGVRALGGGLLAAKMIGVVTGTVVAFSAGGIAESLFGRRAGLLATGLAAIWPAGIAVSSVLGTDMPAAAFGVLAIHALVRFAPRRPWLATILCGLALGLAAWIRAVAAPLAILSLLYWLATGARWPVALGRAATALAIALLVLSPWAIRNRNVYGELFFTDTHGGHTALVGANPNTEGTYSRSLNLMFNKGTGYRLFEPPERHLRSDRAAYHLAARWTKFEPAYAVGLIAAKADRLLTHERNLLYWPVFRQGVLDAARRSFFDAHRAAIEHVTDFFWWLLAALGAAGIGISVGHRSWAALSILVFPLALIGAYGLFFAEVRYHLAIAPLVVPYAACAIDWGWSAAGNRFRRECRSAVHAGCAVVLLLGYWWGLLLVGSELRARHRWAVTVCAYPSAEEPHLCSWRRGLPVGGDSPIRGTWDGVGIRIDRSSQGVLASARTVIPVGAGRFHVRAEVSFTGAPRSVDDGLAVAMRADGRVIARVVSPPASDRPDTPPPAPLPIVGLLERIGGPVLLELQVEPVGIRSVADGGTVWISKLVVERF